MVCPFLYETGDLDIKKVGFVIVQVKNRANYMPPNAKPFKKMDPFLCELLGDEDRPVPIIRIVFTLDGERPSFQWQAYGSPDDGAVTLDRNGQPQFIPYDFWCSGIGPDLLRPVDENNTQTKRETLLDKT